MGSKKGSVSLERRNRRSLDKILKDHTGCVSNHCRIFTSIYVQTTQFRWEKNIGLDKLQGGTRTIGK